MSAHQFLTWIKNSVFSLTIGVVGIVVLILESSGLIPPSSIGRATLALVALLAVSEVLERRRLLSELQGAVEEQKARLQEHDDRVLEGLDGASREVIDGLQGVKVKVFPTIAEFASYYTECIQGAQCVRDTYLQTTSPRDMDVAWIKASARIRDASDQVCRDSDVDWRDIVVFSRQSILEHMKKRIREADNYGIAYFDTPRDVQPPHVSFAIVDEELFLLGAKTFLSVEQPDVVAFFRDYHEAMWNQAHAEGRLLRVGPAVYGERLKALEQLLS
jgi:hypothetical protein